MSCPLVSVIIPNYNHARFLNQRIDSVLAQTYQNYEVIILDDCSSDNSREVIETSRNHPKVSHIILNERNSGSTFVQWNKGFSLAQGELIWLAESDDYCEPTFLEKLVAEYVKYPNIVFVYSDLQHVDATGAPVNISHDNLHNVRSTRPVYEGKDFIQERMLRFNSVWNASSVIFRKDVALELDSVYQTFKGAGDYLFWIMLAECGRVVKVDEPLDYFRIHGSNITPKNRIDGTLFKEEFYILHYLRKKKLIGFFQWLELYLWFYEDVLNNKIYTDSVRKMMIKTCNPYHILTPRTMALSWKLVKWMK